VCYFLQVGVLPGGRQVVSAGDDGQLFVWDAATARMVQAMKGSHAAGISYLGTPRDSRSREGPGARNLVSWWLIQHAIAAFVT
jgi:hypothetical protein